MSEENGVDTEATTTVDETTGNDGPSYEDLVKENAALRKEAAGRRVKNKELDSELEQFKKWKESQLSELEKAQLRVKELETESASLRREGMQQSAAKAAGLDNDLAEYVTGSTEDEMLESAKTLAAKFGTVKAPSRTDLYGGSRGKAVGQESNEDKNALFREYLAGRTVA